MGVIVRGILVVAGLLAALRVARDSAHFGLVQAAIGLLRWSPLWPVIVESRRRKS